MEILSKNPQKVYNTQLLAKLMRTIKKKIEIPYFIKMRGCINCSVSKSSQERFGAPYVPHHELVVGCLLRGCVDESHSLHNPFMDPEEGMILAKKEGNPAYIENIRKYCQKVKEAYGKFYEAIGISLDKIME